MALNRAYHLFYLILARRYDATLVTVDKKLATLATTLGVKNLGKSDKKSG